MVETGEFYVKDISKEDDLTMTFGLFFVDRKENWDDGNTMNGKETLILESPSEDALTALEIIFNPNKLRPL